MSDDDADDEAPSRTSVGVLTLMRLINEAVGHSWVTADDVRNAGVLSKSAFIALGDKHDSPIILVLQTKDGRFAMGAIDELPAGPWPILTRVLRRIRDADVMSEGASGMETDG